MKNCKVCGSQIAKSAKSCPKCGAKNSKPLYKRVWFWVLLVCLVGVVGSAMGNSNSDNTALTNEPIVITETPIEYQVIDIQTLFDDLDNNAAKAKNDYNKKYVEITGVLKVIDSDGKYITISIDGTSYLFKTVQCYIKDKAQLDVVFTKSVGDELTIKGKITSVGEVLGYSLDIDSIN